MELFIDFESRSPLDIKKCGAYAYAEHPDTEVLCLAVKADDGDTDIWVPLEFDFRGTALANFRLRELIEAADHIHAHNAGFERCMWTEHMVKRRGFPEIPISKWDDTAARAAMCALPRSLDGATKALGLSAEKDAEGYKLMLKMCKPKALTKKERIALGEHFGILEEDVKMYGAQILSALKVDPRAPQILGQNFEDYRQFYKYHFTPADFERLCAYCIQDVEAEYALAQELPPPPKMERRIWELDQAINDRGILADLTSVEHAEAIIEEHSSKLQEELQELTGGAVGTAKQVAKMTSWLSENGCELDGLTKQDVRDALSGEIDPAVRRVLEIRQSLSMSSTAKLAAIRAFACHDGRLRGMFMYHGAGTGRWTGKGPQPQNFPRGNETMAPEMILDRCLPQRDLDLIETVWGDPMDVISSCLRGLFVASPGHDLLAADYSAIEGRGLAFLAGEEHVLEGYRNKLDPYRVAASGIFKVPYDQIDKKKRQVGKVAELACFAGDTLVLTDSGFRRIDEISTADKLWDGAEFVEHSGVIDRGEKNVLAVAGIQVTPDHLFLTENHRWVQAKDLFTDSLCLKSALALAVSLLPELLRVTPWNPRGLCACAIAGASSTLCGQMSETGKPYGAGPAGLKELGRSASYTAPSKENTEGICALSSKEFSAAVTTNSTSSTRPTEREEYRYSAHGLEIKNYSWNIWLRSLGGTRKASHWIESMLMGIMSPETYGLSQGKNKDRTSKKQDGSNTTGSACRLRSFGSSIAQSIGCFLQSLKNWRPGAPRTKSLQTKKNVVARTYDILNAGPRNRYMVLTSEGPLIVHNCGYQGSWKAMLAFGADRMGMTEQEMKDAVAGWREARPKTVALWKGLEQAAYLCVEKGVETKFRAIKFRLHGKFLQMILPSGRPLWYFAPRLQPVKTPWGEEKRMVTAMTVDSATKQWVRRSYHGGLWAENATQAFCRDLLALGLIRCEAAGYKVVGHVHDEIVAEVPEGWGSVEEMEAIMSEVPKWAEGMPISAEGYRARRYRK